VGQKDSCIKPLLLTNGWFSEHKYPQAGNWLAKNNGNSSFYAHM